MSDKFPPNAERIDIAKFVTYKNAESRYFKGFQAIVEEFNCACGTLQERPRGDRPSVCPGCGLSLQVYGLHVVVWRDEKVSA